MPLKAAKCAGDEEGVGEEKERFLPSHSNRLHVGCWCVCIIVKSTCGEGWNLKGFQHVRCADLPISFFFLTPRMPILTVLYCPPFVLHCQTSVFCSFPSNGRWEENGTPMPPQLARPMDVIVEPWSGRPILGRTTVTERSTPSAGGPSGDCLSNTTSGATAALPRNGSPGHVSRV